MGKSSFFCLILFITSISITAQKKEYTFDTIFKDRSLYGTSIAGIKWFDNDSKYSFIKYDPVSKSTAIFQYEIKSGTESILVSKNDLILNGVEQDFVIGNYEWSPGEKYILFTDVVPSRGTKSGGTFYVYEVKGKKLFTIAESEEEQLNAGFSPDGEKLGFVRNNNLFTADLRTGLVKQLTFDGSDVILNGVFDWVYEEEFSIIKGWEWSPDGKKIAFWRLDQSPVPEIKIAKWDSLYLNFYNMRYPKPGAKNSIVKIGTVDVTNTDASGKPEITWMDIGEETDIYIPRIKFTANPGLLSIQRLNRRQNKLDFILADVKSGKSKVIFSETSDAWVDIYDDLMFINKEKFIWTSKKDGYQHIYLYDYSGKELKQLTKGKWEIGYIKFADEQKVLFTANERGTRFIDLYEVKTDGTGFKRLTEKAGYHDVDISGQGKYFFDKYSNANTLSSIYLYDTNADKIADLKIPDFNIPEDYGFSKLEFLTFKTSDGVELNASMIKPWNFDENKKYPVVFDIYAGPGSDPTWDRWGSFPFLWKQYMAKNGYIIFTVDNRGTGGRGAAFREIVYKRLGEMEVNDMIEGAKYLSGLKFVDSGRIGIWGGSYGGYVAALTLLKGADYFKAAVDVSGVSDWRFYDDIYTERYMQTPELNPEGYDNSSLLTHAGKLKGKLLIIHGTADDNVHFQNAVELVDKLIEENKYFETMFYPERRHGIRPYQHFYKLVSDFFFKNL